MTSDQPMSLIGFHRFLIVTAILFCLGFAGWEIRAWSATRGTATLVLAVIFVALGVGLALYLRRLGRILGYKRRDAGRRG